MLQRAGDVLKNWMQNHTRYKHSYGETGFLMVAGVVLYTSEYAPAAKFYENNGFKVSQGTICMYRD